DKASLDNTPRAPVSLQIPSVNERPASVVEFGRGNNVDAALVENDETSAGALADVAKPCQHPWPKFRNNGRLVGGLLQTGIVLRGQLAGHRAPWQNKGS